MSQTKAKKGVAIKDGAGEKAESSKLHFLDYAPIIIFAVFILTSFVAEFDAGKQIGGNFSLFSIDMLGVLPCAFVLIGLFEVWVKDETIKKHLGEASGLMGHLWAILLSSTTIGGVYVAFPVAYSLHHKGARLSVVFTYIGASALCRIPMTIFEATFLGIEFSIIRLFISLPLIVVTSMIIGSWLIKSGYTVMKGK